MRVACQFWSLLWPVAFWKSVCSVVLTVGYTSVWNVSYFFYSENSSPKLPEANFYFSPQQDNLVHLLHSHFTGPFKTTDNSLAVCGSSTTFSRQYHRRLCKMERNGTFVKSMWVLNAATGVERCGKSTLTVRKWSNIGRSLSSSEVGSHVVSFFVDLTNNSQREQSRYALLHDPNPQGQNLPFQCIGD